MRRRLFTIASILSLLLCLAVGWLWVGSYHHGYVFIWRQLPTSTSNHLEGQILAGLGFISLDIESVASRPHNLDFLEARYTDPDDVMAGVPYVIGFSIHHNATRFNVTAPCWFVLVITSILPVSWIISHLNRLRFHGKNRCTQCGYNLEGNISGVCPEWGTPVPHKADAMA